MVCISFTGSQIPPLGKQPLKKFYQYGKCFADNELVEITIRFNNLSKESAKEALTAQNRVQ